MRNFSIVLGILITLTAGSVNAEDGSCVLPHPEAVLVDHANTLKDIYQLEGTTGACENYRKHYIGKDGRLLPEFINDPEALKTKVLCGKWIFFNLGMRTSVGLPRSLLRLIESFKSVGNHLTGLGFLEDESWKNESLPFGVIPARYQSPFSIRRLFAGPVVQVSCAGCHAGKLPDGTYSVGAPNANLDFGKFNAYALYSIWLADHKKHKPEVWDKSLIDFYDDLEQQPKKKGLVKMLKAFSFLPFNSFFMKTFINEVAPGMGTQRSFLKSKPGVFNGFAPILNFAEKEIYVSIPQIWGIGRFRPAHYGSLAGMDSIDKFIVEANVITTQANKYNSPEYVEPIKEYMRCLKTPANPGIKKDELFEKGKASFTQNCLKCHDLQDGSSSDAFEFKVLGSPLVFKNLLEDYSPPDFQSKKAYKAFKKAGILYSMADQIRARRLNGIWTRKNFSTNGSLNALEELFCLNGFKRTNPNPQDPLTDGVHMDLCEKYSNDEKLALIEYLNFK